MIAIPVVILLTATVGLGLYLGWRYLKREKNRPLIIGLHFLLGASTLEPMLITLHGALGGPAARPNLAGALSAGFVTLALMSGVTAVMIGRRSRQTANIALSAHAGIAAGAFLLMVAWVASLLR